MLGLITFCGQFPTALLGPLAGVFVDGCDKRKVLFWTQTLSMLQSTLLAVLTISEVITIPQIVVLNIFQALVNAFDLPARQAFLPEIIQERDDLPNAIALNAAMFHGSRLIGPAIAGVLVGFAGEGLCFVVDAVSYGAVLLSLFFILDRNVSQLETHPSWHAAMIDGFRYAYQTKPVRIILTLVAVISLVATPQIALLPVFAREVFGAGPELYGYLAAASGCGSFVGALLLASRPRGHATESVVANMPILLSAGLILFAFATNPWLGGFALFVVGFATVSLLAGSSSMLQMTVDDKKRARVLSLFSASFFGLMPLGGLIAGALANKIGAAATVWIGGCLSLLVGVLSYEKVRQVKVGLMGDSVRIK